MSEYCSSTASSLEDDEGMAFCCLMTLKTSVEVEFARARGREDMEGV